MIRTILKKVFGIQILRIQNIPEKKPETKTKMKYVHDPAFSYMKTPAYKEMLINELADSISFLFLKTIVNPRIFP